VRDQARPVAYRALAARIRDAIRNGDYAGGRQLPTEEQLSASYSVSRQTVRRAMQDLVAEGFIYRVAGRGTYPVAAKDRYLRQFGSVEELMALSEDTECEIVCPLQRQAGTEAAGRLRLPGGEVYCVSFTRLHAGTPFCYTSVFLPPRAGQLLTGIPELSSAGARSTITVIGLVDARLEVAIAAAEQSITATAAPADVAAWLPCAEGDPVLQADRLYFDQDENPVELAVSYFDPRQYSYRVKLRRR
jgi:GntR family transcriptional regulator